MSWTEEDIAKVLTPLLLAYGSGFNTERFMFYVKQLKNIPPYILKPTVQKLINKLTFVPSIAEIRREAKTYQNMADHSFSPDWSTALAEVVREVRQVGHSGHPQIKDKYAEETVRRIGWLNICSANKSDWLTLRAQFRETYNLIVSQYQDRQESIEALRQITQNEAHPALNEKMGLLLKRIDIK